MADAVARIQKIAEKALHESEELWAREDRNPSYIVGVLEAKLRAIIAEAGD